MSFIKADYASNYVYAGNGVVVYPTYILKTTCRAFMPCGVERINIPSDDDRNNNPVRDGNVLFDELSSPGFSQTIHDQRSATYDPLYHQDRNHNQIIIVDSKQDNDDNPIPIHHFADTYNTQNNFDSEENWIGDTRYSNNDYNRNIQTRNTRVIVVYG